MTSKKYEESVWQLQLIFVNTNDFQNSDHGYLRLIGIRTNA